MSFRRPPVIFNVHIGSGASQATSLLENTVELRRVLRAFSSVSKKDSDLRDLGALDHTHRAAATDGSAAPAPLLNATAQALLQPPGSPAGKTSHL